MWSRSPVEVHIAMAAGVGGGRNPRLQMASHRLIEHEKRARSRPARGRPTGDIDAAWIGKPAAAEGHALRPGFCRQHSSRDPRKGLE